MSEKQSHENSNKPVTGVYSLPRVQAIFMAGAEMKIPVTVKSEEGQPYTAQGGYQGIVSEGSAFVEIGTGVEKDLSKFWKRVNKINKLQGL